MIGDRGRQLVKNAEGLRLTAYLCPAGVWTIGWGHTRGVREGDTCTEPEAEVLLSQDLADADAAITKHVTAPLTQSMRDALASWVFNLGAAALASSTMLKRLNAQDYVEARKELRRWTKARDPHTGTFRDLDGLVSRRTAEAALFTQDGLPSW